MMTGANCCSDMERPFRGHRRGAARAAWLRQWFPEMAEFRESGTAAAEEEVDWIPLVDLIDRGKHIVVRAELPGVQPHQLKVTLENNTLWLRGERLPDEEDEHYFCSEQLFGKFSRKVRLPVEVENEPVETAFRNGMLTIKLPKAKRTRPREIKIS